MLRPLTNPAVLSGVDDDVDVIDDFAVDARSQPQLARRLVHVELVLVWHVAACMYVILHVHV